MKTNLNSRIIIFFLAFVLSFVSIIEIRTFCKAEGAQQPNERLDNYDCNSQGYTVHPVFEKFIYDKDEIIPIIFELESESSISSFDYETNGFTVISSPVMRGNTVSVEIKYNNFTTEPLFTITVDADNGYQLSGHIYGYTVDGTLYINGNSFDAAKDIFLSNQLNNGNISYADYTSIIDDMSHECIEEETHISLNPITRSASSNTVVSGRIGWNDDAGVWHPMQYSKVTIHDDDPMFDDTLGTVYTDVNGYYNFSYDNNRDDVFDGSGRDIYIKIYPEGENSVVKTGSGGEYSGVSSTSNDVVTGSTITKSLTCNMTKDFMKAFQISQAVIVAARYAKEQGKLVFCIPSSIKNRKGIRNKCINKKRSNTSTNTK